MIASPTGRTRQTAEAIAEALGSKESFSQGTALASLRAGKTPDSKPVSWAWRQEHWKAGRARAPPEVSLSPTAPPAR